MDVVNVKVGDDVIVDGDIVHVTKFEYNRHIGPEFAAAIRSLPLMNCSLETGTHKGYGTTRILKEISKQVIGIESNEQYYRIARNSNIDLYLGGSLGARNYHDDVRYVQRALDEGLIVDYSGSAEDRVKEYYKEIGGPDELLAKLLGSRKPDLVCLDSSGLTGYDEFNVVMRYRPKYLILDDINHIKHYLSYQDIKDNVIAEGNERFGFAIAKL